LKPYFTRRDPQCAFAKCLFLYYVILIDDLPRLALVVETASAYGRAVVRGVQHHVEADAGPGEPPRWLLELTQPHEATARTLDPGRIAGAIVRLPVARLPTVERAGVPVVMLHELPPGCELPRAGLDNGAVGRAAAAELRALEPAGYGFFGSEVPFAAIRRRAFIEALAEEGAAPSCLSADAGERESLAWLEGLPKPAAIFAAHDAAGLRLVNLCRLASLPVPDSVTVLGVDNDPLLCELSAPTLSSIRVPADRVGREAAALLARMIDGDPAAPRSILLPPGEVVHRQSTDRMRTDDPLVRQALAYLRDRAASPIRVADLLEALGCSRRYLEQAMKQAIGRTPGQELTRLRLQRAQTLLADTDLTLEAIARQSGYRNASRLSIAFKRETGQTPGAYRAGRATSRG